MQQLFPWGEPDSEEQARSPLPPLPIEPSERDERGATPERSAHSSDALQDAHTTEPRGPPIPTPLPDAVAAGVFGLEVSGPIEPDAEQVAALLYEHSNELIGLLGEAEALQDAIRNGADPRNGHTYRDAETAAKAAQKHTTELRRIVRSYADALAVFEEGFGPDATRALDEWVRAEVAGGTHRRGGYDPGHPWHYYVAGDNAPPTPYEQIPPCEDAGRWLEQDLPKNPAKRVAKMRDLLEREEQQLAADRQRYEEVIAHGAEALSRYDREIAYGGNDDLARASTLALKYNHIRLGLGRIAWLRQRVPMQGEFAQ
jgi:hypothetical protein